MFLTFFLFAEGDAMEQSSEDPLPISAKGFRNFCFLLLRPSISVVVLLTCCFI